MLAGTAAGETGAGGLGIVALGIVGLGTGLAIGIGVGSGSGSASTKSSADSRSLILRGGGAASEIEPGLAAGLDLDLSPFPGGSNEPKSACEADVFAAAGEGIADVLGGV